MNEEERRRKKKKEKRKEEIVAASMAAIYTHVWTEIGVDPVDLAAISTAGSSTSYILGF